MRTRKLFSCIYLLAGLFSFTSCFKELCYHHPHTTALNVSFDYYEYLYSHTTVELDPDWQFNLDVMDVATPTGIRVESYRNGSTQGSYNNNISGAGGKVSLPEGEYNFLIYNNDSEYIRFDGPYTGRIASTGTTTRQSYNTKNPDEQTVYPPDLLYSIDYEGLTIEQEDPASFANNEQRQVYMSMKISPRVFVYAVRFRFDYGLEHVKESRAFLAGMAGNVDIKTGDTSDHIVTYSFTGYIQEKGIEGAVRTFGAPSINLVKEDEDNTRKKSAVKKVVKISVDDNDQLDRLEVLNTFTQKLTLELRLKNNKVISREFDVTNQITKNPRGGLIEVSGIVVTDEEADGGSTGGGGGFDAGVADWEEEVEVFVPIG